jgi:hypothetical protein
MAVKLQARGRSVAGFSPQRDGFDPRPVHVGFLVKEMPLGPRFLSVLLLSLVSIVPPMPHTHSLIPVYPRRRLHSAMDSVVK